MAARCSKCGSDKVVPNAKLFDQGEHSDGALKAAFEQHPSAWFFKGRVLSNLRATICGVCGFTELYAEDPLAIYERYLLSKPNRDVPQDAFMEFQAGHARAISNGFEPGDEPESTPDNACLQCGALMPEEEAVCASCGWTYQSREPA
jgi:hypothetical protein